MKSKRGKRGAVHATVKPRPSAGVMAEINVTPLVDVVLVLLIIFMVVTPMLQKGQPVDRAPVDNPRDMKEADQDDAVLIAVARDGSFAGVVAETEAAAEAGLAALRKSAAWSAGDGLPDEANLADWLKSQPAETTIVEEKQAAARSQVASTVRRARTSPSWPVGGTKNVAP